MRILFPRSFRRVDEPTINRSGTLFDLIGRPSTGPEILLAPGVGLDASASCWHGIEGLRPLAGHLCPLAGTCIPFPGTLENGSTPLDPRNW